MNIIQKAGAWLFNIDGNSASLSTSLPEELIERDTVVKEMSKKLQSQDAQLSKISAKEKLKKESEVQLGRDQEQIKDLKEQETQKKIETFEGSLGFDELQRMLSKRKFYDKIIISDRDGIANFGRFGRFVFLPNGYIGLQERDSGKIISYGPSLDEVIYKPEGLKNQFLTGMIRLPCDENYQFLPDIEKTRVPKCMFNEETGQIDWAIIDDESLLEAVQSREIKIGELSGYIKKLEADKIGLVNNNRDLRRALGIHKNTAEVAQTETSKAVGMSMQYQTAIGDLQRRVIQLNEMKIINDKLVSGYESVNQKLLDAQEEVGDKTKFREVLATVQDMIEWSKNNIGETVINKQEITETSEKSDNKEESAGGNK